MRWSILLPYDIIRPGAMAGNCEERRIDIGYYTYFDELCCGWSIFGKY